MAATMNTQNLIGLVGKKRVGKDTFADFLCKNHGYVKYSFAGPLKKACQEIFLLSDDQLETDLKEVNDPRWGITPRKLFQQMGTEVFRNKIVDFFPEFADFGTKIWIYRFKLWFQEKIKENPNIKVIISDIRFEDEAEIVSELGGMLIKIARTTRFGEDTHSSEQNIDKIACDKSIENKSSVGQYLCDIEKMLNLK